MNYEKVFIIDTNVILEDANQLLTIAQNGKNLLVLPETVIDELDAKKSGFNEINFQAREFGRILSDAKVIKTENAAYQQHKITIMSLSIDDDTLIDIVSFDDYNLTNVDKSIINDRKIIKVAEFSRDYYNVDKTILLSNDIMCRTRAIALNVKTQAVTNNSETLKVDFTKTLENMDSSKFNLMSGKNIRDFDPDYEPENYCYWFKAKDGNQKIAYIVNERITFIDDSLFNALTVRPLNKGQKFAMAGMLDEGIDVCVTEALAGSGKTLLALSAGMKLVQQGKYNKIIYIRNSVESTDKAEEVGFLPGLEEKFIIYNYPLYDTLEFIAQREMKTQAAKQSKESIDAMVESLVTKYHIETLWNGSIRGRTISNAFVIVDEVQNFGKTSLQTVLSRLDKDSKVVCIGSNRQIDHPYINQYTNGLSVLLKAAKEENPEVTIFGAELNKVVRGKITEWTERIFENKR